MFNSPSYGKWLQRLKQYIPDTCSTRLTNLALLLVGIYSSKSVYLSVIACKIPVRAQKWSIAKRLNRFLSNAAVDVEAWYHPWASWLLASAGSGGQIHLVIDTTKVSAQYRLLMVAVAYHGRTLPVMWDWVPYQRGRCTTQLQTDLLKRLYPLIRIGVRVSLVGDTEFNHPDLIEQLKAWGWDYVLRQKGNTVFRVKDAPYTHRIDSLPLEPGDLIWLMGISLTETRPCETRLLLYWKEGEKEPWYLATNQSTPADTLDLYRRRVWIEEMFGDLKGHGFDLELSRLQTPDRLSRLTLAVCIVYVWLVGVGEYVWTSRLHTEVDRKDRRDLSFFRLGWDWLERRFTFNDPIPICFMPNFCSVSGC